MVSLDAFKVDIMFQRRCFLAMLSISNIRDPNKHFFSNFIYFRNFVDQTKTTLLQVKIFKFFRNTIRVSRSMYPIPQERP